jgi:hypothetical protein
MQKYNILYDNVLTMQLQHIRRRRRRTRRRRRRRGRIRRRRRKDEEANKTINDQTCSLPQQPAS